jgi:hypothetical protein
MDLLPELSVALEVLFPALLVVGVYPGRKLKAGLHLPISPLRAAPEVVRQLTQEGHDAPVLLRVLVDLRR